MHIKTYVLSTVFIMAAGLVAPQAMAQSTTNYAGPENIDPVREESGRYFAADDAPTFKVAADGTVDFPTSSGFRRYHSECHVCHGPDGEGSTYAPALKKSAISMDYYDFIGVVAGGKQQVDASSNLVMPSFGTNPNVMCYLDDIYTYLKARGMDAIPRGRPAKKEPKSDEFASTEASCMGN
jgi:methanol metabolism-related c-type cytochrome